MTEAELILEVGSTAVEDLTTAEKAAILATFSAAQARLAGMATFDLLKKKFKPSYKMGKAYIAESDRYEKYQALYNEYAMSTNAGRVTGDSDSRDDYKNLDRWKFPADAN